MKGEFSMTNKVKDQMRRELIQKFYEFWEAQGEDVGMIKSNSFNFPIVSADGEEGWAKVTLTITNDEDDMGYMEREQYASDCKNKAETAAKKKKDAELKAKRDAEKRAQKLAKLNSKPIES